LWNGGGGGDGGDDDDDDDDDDGRENEWHVGAYNAVIHIIMARSSDDGRVMIWDDDMLCVVIAMEVAVGVGCRCCCFRRDELRRDMFMVCELNTGPRELMR